MAKTYATAPLKEMNAVLSALKAHEAPLRRRVLAITAETLLSEAQADAPVKTGTLKDAHIIDASDPDRPAIGANTTYALAVHARHPTKAQWFLNAIVKGGKRVMEGALKIATKEAADAVSKGGGA